MEYHLYAGRSEQHKERIVVCGERKVLKFSSIYGANASGKTNLIKAIDTGRRIVLGTMENGAFHDRFCRSDPSNADKPTLFEYEFTIGERCFAYGFTVNLERNKVVTMPPVAAQMMMKAVDFLLLVPYPSDLLYPYSGDTSTLQSTL